MNLWFWDDSWLRDVAEINIEAGDGSDACKPSPCLWGLMEIGEATKEYEDGEDWKERKE